MRLGEGVTVAIIAGIWLAGGPPATAGTKGGAYDFSYFLSQPHPFARSRPATAAPTMRPAPAMPTPTDEIPLRRRPMTAPPPPPAPPVPYRPARQTAEAATNRPAAAGDPYRDATDGWFDRLYVSVGAGVLLVEDIDGRQSGSIYNVDYDIGYAVDLALGTYFTPEFRGELALTYRTSESDSATIAGTSAGSADLTTYSIMANGYYDFLLDWEVHPYVGAGVGLDILDGDSFSAGGVTVGGKDGVEVGYQLAAGLAWEFSPTMVVSLDYRYHASSDDDLVFHTVQGGLRYNF